MFLRHHSALSLAFLIMAFANPARGDGTETLTTKTAWEFPSEDDDFSKPDALNLRNLLNEPQAGAHGFIKLSADGTSFVRGDGEPIRFWAVVSDGYRLSPKDMERHAAWLAKRGVNMVRIHCNISAHGEGDTLDDVNYKEIDAVLRWIAVCKKHGIYTTLSPFWAYANAPASWGLEGYEGVQPWGLLFFNPKLREAYKKWVRVLYTTPNPYAGGVPLRDEPALAIAQVKNEDSLLFWTFSAIKPPQMRILGKQFYDWASAKYGSGEKILPAWDNAKADGDDLESGVLGFRNLWEMTTQAPRPSGGSEKRLADQTQFLTETMRAFYADLENFYKKEIGIRSLTNAMNWRSADPLNLDDAERYSYTAMDVLAVNFYTSGIHVGENNGYRIDPGHKFTNGTVLRGTAPLPSLLKQAAGHPMIITETAWVHPNLYQSEGPFLMTAYQSLNGVDATYWFAFPGHEAPEWNADTRAMFWPVGDSHAVWKWYGNFPMQAGQFPAFALAFRRGDIATAKEPAVYEERSLDDLWQRKIPIISESGRFDPNRDEGLLPQNSPVRQLVSRDAFFVGPVIVKYGGDAKNNRVIDLDRFINNETGDLKSMTGELVLNRKRGIATINAPRIQGVCGFTKDAGRTFDLGATKWEIANDYISLVAVSLDDEPLETSKRILVQAGTVARLSGFSTRPSEIEDAETGIIPAEEIVSNGKPPWLVAKTKATLTLQNAAVSRASALDPNLRPGPPIEVKRLGDKAVIELPEDALYTLIER